MKSFKFNNRLRLISQLFFLFLTIWIGIEFFFYYNFLYTEGKTFYIPRPSGVEAFLPISSIMNLLYWVISGELSLVHPAGVFILISILIISLVFKKSFCSWVCPVGFVSESLGEFGKKIFGKNLKILKFLDYPLRSLKYLLLLFFLFAIFSMSVNSLYSFLESPYNKIADIKMLLFFMNMSKFTAIILIVLVIASIFIYNFWCRYLCPYGALLGIISYFSPFKIRRNKETCTDCKACTGICPSYILVHKLDFVKSDECMSCLKCSSVCPVSNTLEYKLIKSKINFDSKKLIFGILILYFGIIFFAMISGLWKSSVSDFEYMRHVKNLNSFIYSHPSGF
ncbi:MAG TPA: 4Fe-4S binding protein [Bacteroidota bacterium]|nr:4Fe-4S binding protein [Bacteroidota bacterium]